jgi:hypothetical protein
MMFTKILIANPGFVIASEAKQSNGAVPLDCRVASLLAMTGKGKTVRV